MTTIAANRKCMAGDRRVTEECSFYSAKKVFVIGEAIVGVAGVATSTNKWLSWYRSGCPTDGPSFTEDEGMQALVLKKDGLFYYTQGCDPDQILEGTYAIGTGAPSAIALMRACKWHPRRAVLGANKVDGHTGAEVDVIELAAVTKLMGR